MDKKLRVNIWLFIMLLIGTTSIVSCSNDDDGDGKRNGGLYTNVTELIFYNDSTLNIDIKSNKPWKIKSNPSWVVLNATSGDGDFRLALKPYVNIHTQTRYATFTIYTETESVDINLIQGALINVSNDEFNLGPEADSKETFTVRTESTWTINNVPSWLKLSAMSGDGKSNQVEMTAEDNTNGVRRTAAITIEQEYSKKIITVTQEGTDAFEVSPTDVLTLNNGIAFMINGGSRVTEYALKIVDKEEMATKSESQIKAELEASEFSAPTDELLHFKNDAKPDTEYYVYMITKTVNGKTGNMTKATIKTQPVLSQSPRALISKAYLDGSKIYFTLTMNQYAKSFYTMTSLGSAATLLNMYPDVILAYQMKKLSKISSSSGTYYSSPSSVYGTDAFLIITFSIDASGNTSDVIEKYYKNNASYTKTKAVSKQPEEGRIDLKTMPELDIVTYSF